jgi:hypothetical protein
MRSHPPRRSAPPPGSSLLWTAVALWLATGCGSPEPLATTFQDGEGTFIVRLGTDTVSVERYSLSPERMEVLAVTRSPRTLLREVTLEFGDGGQLERYESRVREPGAAADELLDRTVVTWEEGDSVRVESGVGDAAEIRRMAGSPDMIPLSFNHFSLVEAAIRRGLDEDLGQIRMWSGGPAPMGLERVGRDSVALVTPQLGTWRVRVDDEGRILGMHAGALGRDVERVPDLDVDALAARFADEDARGEGMGPLSPRDTVRATVAGAELTVDYSRPAARGRQVFGGLVPYGEIWRTGADLATHLTTTRPLRIGDEVVPPGTYTLFTIPEPESWTVILNRQTGQPGTEYDEELDLLRAEVPVAPAPEAMNRFTIEIGPEDDGGVLRLLWEDAVVSVPFRVEAGGAGEQARIEGSGLSLPVQVSRSVASGRATR